MTLPTSSPSSKQQVLTVSQITQEIKDQLEGNFPSIQIQGEISNFKKQFSGHLYFSLKDDKAQVSCVMFRGFATRLSSIPKDGDQVIISGEVTVYAPRGNYQILVKSLRMAGVGELLVRLEALKKEIQRRGWFSASAKKELPPLPKKIGVITSPTGAVIQDILNVLNRRHSEFHLILYPVKVQGEGAAQEISTAIDEMNRLNLVDVLIIGRGGGSIEDLWAFNEEVVAASIFHSDIPIISAVGHESDHTIADYVADVRAPTPSAAAELVISEKQALLDTLDDYALQIQRAATQYLQQSSLRLKGALRHPFLKTPYLFLGPHMQKIDDLRSQLDQGVSQKLKNWHSKLEGFLRQHKASNPTLQCNFQKKRLQVINKDLNRALQLSLSSGKEELIKKNSNLNSSIKQYLQSNSHRFSLTKKTLQTLNPKNVLSKGYGIVFSQKSHSVILDATELNPEQNVEILLAKGRFEATVKKVFE
jgi:exodeoxyribonuclease VII large subunit